MAERLTTNQEVPGSTPGWIEFVFLLLLPTPRKSYTTSTLFRFLFVFFGFDFRLEVGTRVLCSWGRSWTVKLGWRLTYSRHTLVHERRLHPERISSTKRFKPPQQETCPWSEYSTFEGVGQSVTGLPIRIITSKALRLTSSSLGSHVPQPRPREKLVPRL
ncbi:hypothetical protein GE21DRAFT_1054429 [Neurospora crassa]|nr:hypothetical protein GE21DRAFT_1054429 [Neurospora crassa]